MGSTLSSIFPRCVRGEPAVVAGERGGSTRPDLAYDPCRGFRTGSASVEVVTFEVTCPKTKGILVYTHQSVERWRLPEAAGGFSVHATLRVGQGHSMLLCQLL